MASRPEKNEVRSEKGSMAASFSQLIKHPLGAASLAVIVLVALAALSAYAWIPDATPQANQMNLALANKAPGTKVNTLRLPREERETPEGPAWLRGAPRRYREVVVSRVKQAGDTLLYRRYPREKGPWQVVARDSLLLKAQGGAVWERTFWLGTDRFGRDLLSRLVLGARVSLAVGLVAVFISLIIGIPLGALAAFYGGWVDKLILWLINVVWSIPGLLLVIALTLALGKGFWQVFVAIGLTMWVEVARVIRGQVLSIREKEYVQAARVLGFGDMRILGRHILPNAVAPLIVISAANFAAAILVESGLSFLGIGAQPPTPSWGGMIKDHYAYIIMDKAYLALIPGLAIMLLVLAFMTLGNALRDVLDVRSGKEAVGA